MHWHCEVMPALHAIAPCKVAAGGFGEGRGLLRLFVCGGEVPYCYTCDVRLQFNNEFWVQHGPHLGRKQAGNRPRLGGGRPRATRRDQAETRLELGPG